ncbi:TetR/AcrR family transcriptional repressor of lmrAB and yxaGH operons [Devosia sp. 2618]
MLIARKGLQGASFSQILEESGAPRGSLYHHFPGGKDELVLEAIVLAGDQALAVLDALTGKSAEEVATTFVSLWRALLSHSDFSASCSIAAVTVATDSVTLRERAGEIFRTWRTRLAELLEDGGVPAGRGTAVAASLIAACEGAVILSRAEKSMETFNLVTGEQLSLIKEISKGWSPKRG